MGLNKRFTLFVSKKKYLFFLFLFSSLIFFIIWTQPSINQRGTIKIWDRSNILLYVSSGTVGNKIPVTYDTFPKDLINATIASEDDTFWTNPGTDVQAIARSI